MSDPKHAAKPKETDPKTGSAPDHVYAGGRFGKWLGKFLGGEGRRTGARDTDPGS